MIKSTLLNILLLLCFLGSAQEDVKFVCDSDKSHEKMMAQDRIYKKNLNKFESSWKTYASVEQGHQKMQFTLPVVVHIIHNFGSENISDNEAIEGIRMLNEAFANTGYYQGTGVDVEIEFCLAARSPDGTPTNGINRVNSTYTEFNYSIEESAMKNLSRWDPYSYINIWVVREICSSNGCGVAGYAYLPSAHGRSFDGIVVESEYIGRSASNTSVLVHEMGHYLGLYHTFQRGCTNNDCLSDGDRVCDTPPDQTTVRSSCDAMVNSCMTDSDDTSTNNPFRNITLGGLGDQEDHFHNYMDYSRLVCYDQFTDGQKERMHFAVQGIRNSLLDSKACQDPCLNPVSAIFTTNQTQIDVGETVDFTNQSQGATSYNWYLDGVLFSTNVNVNYSFNAEGVYTVVLEAFSDDPNCSSTFDSILINVTCPLVADFSVSQTEIDVGETVDFTNQSQGATSYNWYLDGVLFSTNANVNYSFNAEGIYTVVLEAFSDDLNCSSTFDTILITVTCPVIADFNFTQSDDLELSFEDESINASSVEYEIYDRSGTLIYSGTDRDFIVTFPAEGGYLVTLRAVGTACEEVLVRWIFVAAETEEDECNETVHTRIIKSSGTDDILPVLTKSQSGVLYVSYLEGTKVVVNIFSKELILISSHEFDAYPNFLGSRSLIGVFEDNDGDLVYQVRLGVRAQGVIIKYSPFRNEVLWSNTTVNSGLTVHSFHEHFENEYLLIGQTDVCSEAYILKISKSTGEILWEREYSLGCTTFFGSAISGEYLYLSGRYAFGGTTSSFRAGVSKIYLPNMNMLWNKHYFREEQDIARQYVMKLVVDKNSIYCVGYSNRDGTSLEDLKTLVFKIDLNGELNWAKEIDIIQGTTEFGSSINLYNDQLYLMGRFNNSSRNNQDLFYIVLDTLGEVSKVASIDINNEENILSFGTREIYDGSKDAFIIAGSAGQDGFITTIPLENPESEKCLSVEDLLYNEYTYSGPNEFNHTFTESQRNLSYIDRQIYPVEEKDIELEDCGETIPDICLSIEKDTLCVPYGGNIMLKLEWCLKKGVIEGNYNGILLNGNPFDNPGNQIDVVDERSVLMEDSCQSELWIMPSDILTEDRWHYVLANYDENHGSSNWRDGFPNNGNAECEYANNIDSFYLTIGPPPPNLGPDIEVCDNQIFNFLIPGYYESIRWSDGTIDSFYTAYSDGLHWVEVSDFCGNVYRDSVRISYSTISSVDLGDDIEICQGGQVELETNRPFSNYQWFPSNLLNCNNCEKVIVDVDTTITVSVTVDNGNGCYSTDSVRIEISKSILIDSSETACQGDTVVFRDMLLTSEGIFMDTSINSDACDSFFTLDVKFLSNFLVNMDVEICAGDSININGQWISSEGSYELEYKTKDGCDSIVMLNVIELDTLRGEASFLLCPDESIMLDGQMIDSTGIYPFYLSANAGCDSTFIAYVEVLNYPEDLELEIDCTSGSALLSVPLDAFWKIEWSNGDTSLMTNYFAGDQVQAERTTTNGCTIVQELDIPELPQINFVPMFNDTLIGHDETLRLSAELDPLDWTINWSPEAHISCNTCFDVVISPRPDGMQVYVEMIHSSGCIYRDSFFINVLDKTDIYVPNAFSPNADNNNDFWRVFLPNGVDQLARVQIYDRWGSQILDKRNVTDIIWDGTFNGKPMNPAVFVYVIEYSDIVNRNFVLSGDLTLLR